MRSYGCNGYAYFLPWYEFHTGCHIAVLPISRVLSEEQRKAGCSFLAWLACSRVLLKGAEHDSGLSRKGPAEPEPAQQDPLPDDE